MTQPTYTPYDGSARLFTIGLGQLDPERWLEPDDEIERYLAEKERVLAQHRNQVFVEEDGTREAQAEVLDLVADFVTRRHPQRYRRDGEAIVIENGAGGRKVRLEVAVRAAPWIDVAQIEVLVGAKGKRSAFALVPRSNKVERLRRSFELEVTPPTFVIVVAEGARGLPNASRDYTLPYAFTNPIWLE